MAKLKNAIFGLSASGSISPGLTYLRRLGRQIVEKTPVLKDQKTTAQLSWRHMFLKVVALWHALSAAEKLEWESAARPKHMTGYAWFVSQALRPNPGIYLPLQGGTMAGIIDMDGYPIQDLLNPVNPQDADTEAARDAAIAAAIGGSLHCDIYGWDGGAWQKLTVGTPGFGISPPAHALDARAFLQAWSRITGKYENLDLGGDKELRIWPYTSGAGLTRPQFAVDGEAQGHIGFAVQARLYGLNGVAWDRLRTYPAGILKVGRAEIGLSSLRRTIAGQVKAAAGALYWMVLNPSAGSSLFELSNDLDGSGAIVLDHFDTTRDGHMMTFDPPMEFSTGIYLKTLTNITSITFGYK